MSESGRHTGGRRPAPRPTSGSPSRPKKPVKPIDDWSYRDYDEHGFWATAWHKRGVRRRKRKARVAAMTRGKRVARRSMILGTWFLGAMATIMAVAVVLFYTLTGVPRPETLPLPQVATIQYSDGSTLARIGNVDRTIVRLDQVPQQVRWAVLAAEDRDFYSNSAVSVKGTLRAAFKDVTGGEAQGGSGITQQYVKNAYLSDAQTLSRKLKELMIAIKLTREYSKDQILEFYLNTVYFGRGAYGIQAAAQAFFGIDVEKLTTEQGAVLAGLLRAPSYYDPVENPTVAKQRWRYVLDGMVKTGHLTRAQEASAEFPKTQPVRGTGLGATGWKYLLKNAVLAELARHGISAGEVAAKGLTIRTTIDKKAQSAALRAIRGNFDHLTKKQRNLKNSLVAVRPDDGAVLAYYGGSGPDVKGYDGKVDYNDYASRGVRPPGSSFKPYTLATVLTNTVRQAEGQAHYTINSKVDGSYCKKIEGTKICNDPGDQSKSGPRVKLANAMKFSLNTTFDLLASEVGPDEVAKTAHAMGISVDNPNGGKSLQNEDGRTTFGIGIGDYPVSVLDQANGYATLQNNGMRNDTYFVKKATSSSGDVVYSYEGQAERAIGQRVANDVTLTLEPIPDYTGVGLRNGRKAAAKTGTVGISGRSTNNSDAWMVGYTPQVSAAVWVGTGYSRPIYNANGRPMYGADLPSKTWKAFMDDYLKGQKKLPMAKERQIATDGESPSPTPTYTPPAPSTPSTPTDTPSPSDTLPSPTLPPVTQAPTTTPPTKTKTRPKPSSTKTCGGVLLPPCKPDSGGGDNVDRGGGDVDGPP